MFKQAIGFLIVALATIAVVLAMMKKPFNTYVDIVIILLALLLIAYSLYAGPFDHKETYVDVSLSDPIFQTTTPTVPSLNDAILALVTQTASNGTSSTRGTATGENISKFAGGLTLYYTSFSPSSYPNTSRRWFNISPFFATSKSCPDVSIDNTHIYFSETPGYSKARGFSLGRNVITGPMCYQLGISMNDSFTIAFAMKFDSFSTVAPTSNLEILKMYANTSGNNGLSLYLTNDYTMANTSGDISVNMYMAFGSLTPKLVSGLTSINPAYVYMFVISKSGLNITLDIYPNIADLSSNSSTKFIGVQIAVPANEDVLLSNKELKINGQANLQAHIYNFAVWNTVLSSYSIIDVYKNTQVELQKTNEMLVDLAKQIADLKNRLLAKNSCPYDAKTCKACTGVTDWNNMSDIVLNAGSDCLYGIDQYCTNNPTVQACTCWNTSSALSSTPQCVRYTSIFNPNNLKVTEEDIDADVLAKLKSKYNLCGCEKAVVPVVPTVPIPSVGSISSYPLIPRMINNVYTISASDIEAYNQIKVGTNIPANESVNGGMFAGLLASIKSIMV